MRLLYIFVFSLSLMAEVTLAQPTNRTELEKRRASLLNEIANTQQQLEATKQDKKATLGQLRTLTAQLDARQRLINTISSELNNIDGTITNSAAEIQTLNSNLATLKKTYAKTIRYAYQHRINQNMMAFLFSANDFNDAMRRMQYLRKYREYRKGQAEKIRVTQELLTQKIGVLNNQKAQKGKLLQTEEVQKKELQQETQQTNLIVSELKGREKELVAQIQQNQKTARKLESSIKEQIRKEIELARKKAEEEARKKAAAEALARKKAQEEEARKKAAAAAAANTYQAGNQTVNLNTGSGQDAGNKPVAVTKPATPTEKPTQPTSATNNNSKPNSNSGANTSNTASNKKPAPEASKPIAYNNAPKVSNEPVKVETPSYKLGLTPEVQTISNSFAANRGRLPWPVEKGFISGLYGKHPNKLFPKVIEENNGIDITTGASAPVRAVFEGTVVKVVNISGLMVLVSHGEYFTVYNYMSSASVSVGDKVSAKQIIGRAGTNDSGENLINFQIWKVGSNGSFSTVDPGGWIAK